MIKNKSIFAIITILFIIIIYIVLFSINNKNKSSTLDLPNKEVIKKLEELDSNTENIEIKNDSSSNNINSGSIIENNSTNIESKINNNDIELFNIAIKDTDINKCNDITNELTKKKCVDNLNLEYATKENDINYCNKINEINSKNKCLSKFFYEEAINTNNIIKCGIIVGDNNLKENCKSKIIFSMIEKSTFDGSIEICSNLNNYNKKYCEDIINSRNVKIDDVNLMNDALKKNDTQICEKIELEKLKNSCKDTVNIKNAISKNDKRICLEIFDESKKISCIENFSNIDDKIYFTNAINNLDINNCKTIILSEMKDKCTDTVYLKISILNKNIKLCDMIIDFNTKKECLKVLTNLLK